MKKIILLSIFIMAICLSACNKNNEEITTQAEITDPFVNDSQTEKKSISLGEFHIKSDIFGEITYSGDSICVNENIKVSKADIEFGFITFINGIPQINDNTNEVLTRISIKEDEEETLPLKITPNCGKQGDKLRMDISSVFRSDFVPEEGKFQFGNYQSSMSARPIIINYEKSSEEKEFTIYTEQTTRYPTDSENERYNLTEKDCDFFELAQSDNTDYFNIDNNTVKFSLRAYAGTSETYRISLFKNHELVKINGCDVADIKLNKGRVTEMDIELDDVKVGDFVYAYYVPITNDIFMADKTDSVKIMPEDFTIESQESIPQVTEEQKSNIAKDYDYLSLLYADDKYTYFSGYKDEKNYIFYMDDNKNIVKTSKTLDVGCFESFNILSNGYEFINCDIGNPVSYMTLDDNFEVTGCYDLKDDIGIDEYYLFYPGQVDAYKNKVIFIAFNEEKPDTEDILIYDTKTKKTKVVCNIEKFDSNYVAINSIKFLGENKACFNAGVVNSHDEKSYIGVIDLSDGNIEFKKASDEITNTIHCAENTACWFSQRKEANEISDGIIHLYYNNGFHEINCENKNENQNVFLSNDGKRVATYLEDETGIEVSVYDIASTKKILKKHIELDKNNSNSYSTQICISSNKVYVYNGSGSEIFEVYNLEG